MENSLITLGLSLSEVIAKNSISLVGNRMALAREKKDLESQSLAYTEIINDLLKDKNDLSLIAREYKEAYEQITISDEDIEYLHRTLSKGIEVLNSMGATDPETNKSMDDLIQLLNKDTLKTMQLIGFNYKEAIGKPLTDACSEAIRMTLTVKPKGKKRK